MNRNSTMKPSLQSAPVSPPSVTLPPRRRRHGRSLGAGLFALLTLLVVMTASRPAAALDASQIQPGQEAAFAVDAVFGIGSIVSIAGNAADLARGRPQRGWMYSGFIFGWINTVIGPLLMVYGREPDPNLGLGLGAAHVVLGITNLALAIRSGVVWHRLRVAERGPPPPAVSLAPLLGRDRSGGSVYGLSLQVVRF